MNPYCFLTAAALVFSGFLCAGAETVILNQNFDSEEALAEWRTSQKPVFKDPRYKFFIQEEAGRKYIHTTHPMHFAVMLKPAIKVGDNLKKISISVELRNAPGANILSFSMSDEPYYFENPFRTGARDSGFLIQGYQHGNNSNLLKWRREGEEVVCRPSVQPYNFLARDGNHKWTVWKLVYNHAEKQLEFTRENETKPFLIQHGVDLTGITLKRFFLKCGGNDYRSAKITVETK